jgi:hypothetical protein
MQHHVLSDLFFIPNSSNNKTMKTMALLTRRATRPLHLVFILSIFIQTTVENVEAFSSYRKMRPRVWKHSRQNSHVLRQSRNNENVRILAFREEQTRLSLIEVIMALPAGKSLLTTQIVGQAQLAMPRNQTRTCAVLAREEAEDASTKTPTPCLFVPLNGPNQLKLLSFAISNKPISKTILLGLNTLLVNRDDALFDNLPWSTWTVDPAQRNRDAAGNAVNKLFHFGKRDAYNRFMGKDWHGESLAMGNLALRLESSIAAASTETDDPSGGNPQQPADDAASLAQRILELQIRELEMDLAECDYQLAVSRTNNPDQMKSLQSTKETCLNQLEISQRRLQEMLKTPESTRNSAAWISSVIDGILNRTTVSKKNSAPYRGATGYAPMLESRDNDPDKDKRSYTSPYDFMREVIENQLNAQVIGAILENSSLLDGTSALGGALILRRLVATKSVTIAGESLQVSDDEEDFGNEGILGGETVLVECNADEAIGMSIACNVLLRIESDIWERASLMAEPQSVARSTESSSSVNDALPIWTPLDPELSILAEGQAGNQSTTDRVSPLRIPRTTTSLFDVLSEPSNNDQSRSSALFPTDNPIQSLPEYDRLSNDEKARTLMSMSNFEGKLPRPRVLRTIDSSDRSNPLDDLLLPLVDESVRRQYRIRDAEQCGDTELVRELQSEKSRRQVAKEKAEEAREMGVDDMAESWDQEADTYSDLRADVTQDEGSYSRFLDRDDWYERDRQAHAKRLDKKKFGTLLDGLE